MLLGALAAANPAKPPPTMMTLGCDMITSIPFGNALETLLLPASS